MDESDNKRKYGTAYRFLKFVRSLRTVLLQDVAAMMAMHGKRFESNYVYVAGKELFESEAFKVSFVCVYLCLFIFLS